MHKPSIKVETLVKAHIEKVWEYWANPKHIQNWNFATEDWCCPAAINDLRPRGEFNWRMEARDGKMGFDFSGIYEQVIPQQLITYEMADGRKVKIQFSPGKGGVLLSETFETENTNSAEQERAGWQAILENFKKYVESDQS